MRTKPLTRCKKNRPFGWRLVLLSFGLLLLVGCKGGDEVVDVPVLGNAGDYQLALEKAQKLSEKPLAKVAEDQELTETEKKDLIKAAAQFQALADFDPKQFAPHLAKGMIYRALGDLEMAERNLQVCLANIPATNNPAILETSAETHYQLSRVLYDAGQYENAVAEASTALEGNPQNPNYLIARASGLAKIDKVQEAKKDIEAALKLDPEHKRANGLKKLLK